MAIHQEILLTADIQRVYEALTIAEQFAELTGEHAEIDPVAGGKFSCFGGMILGQTIENIPAERLVQAWRVANWAPGVYSIVKYEFEKVSDTETRLILDHAGYPQEDESHLGPGWDNKYWKPLKKYLAS